MSYSIYTLLLNSSDPCTDSGIFVRGDPGHSDKKSSDNIFFF